MIATVVLSKLATLKELQEDYGVKDLYDLNEIQMINNANECLLQEDIEKQASYEEELAKRSQ